MSAASQNSTARGQAAGSSRTSGKASEQPCCTPVTAGAAAGVAAASRNAASYMPPHSSAYGCAGQQATTPVHMSTQQHSRLQTPGRCAAHQSRQDTAQVTNGRLDCIPFRPGMHRCKHILASARHTQHAVQAPATSAPASTPSLTKPCPTGVAAPQVASFTAGEAHGWSSTCAGCKQDAAAALDPRCYTRKHHADLNEPNPSSGLQSTSVHRYIPAVHSTAPASQQDRV